MGFVDFIFCVGILDTNVQTPVQEGLSQKGDVLVPGARKDVGEELSHQKQLEPKLQELEPRFNVPGFSMPIPDFYFSLFSVFSPAADRLSPNSGKGGFHWASFTSFLSMPQGLGRASTIN